MASQSAPRDYPLSSVAVEAERLLRRYPTLSSRELARLIEIVPQIPILDGHLIRAEPDLASRMDAFRKDHRTKLRQPSTLLFTLAFLAIPIVMIVGLLWWAVSPPA